MNRYLDDLVRNIRDGGLTAFEFAEDFAAENRRLSEFLVIGLIPALFVTLFLLVGGVRNTGLLLSLFFLTFVLIGGIVLVLPREDEPEVRIHRPVIPRRKSRFDREIAPLVQSLQKRESRRPELFRIHPPIADDALISASIYLNRSGYNAANLSGTDNVLSRTQERKLREYMIQGGFAYQFRDGDRMGWSLNAAGRSMLREYITQLLLDEIDAQLSDTV
jgi:hypothetical protein